MSLPNLEQRRARHAWATVQAVKSKEFKGDKKKFGNHARKLPTRIMAAGLGQALAFLYAKGYADLLLQAITDWVLYRGEFNSGKLPTRDALIIAVTNGNSDTLRRHTAETLAYLQWVIRFAEAENLMDADGGGSDT